MIKGTTDDDRLGVIERFKASELPPYSGKCACGGDLKGDVVCALGEVVVEGDAKVLGVESKTRIKQSIGKRFELAGQELLFGEDGFAECAVIDADLRKSQQFGIENSEADVHALVGKGEVLPFFEVENA